MPTQFCKAINNVEDFGAVKCFGFAKYCKSVDDPDQHCEACKTAEDILKFTDKVICPICNKLFSVSTLRTGHKACKAKAAKVDKQ